MHIVELVTLYGLGGLVVACVCAKCDPWSEYLLKLVKIYIYIPKRRYIRYAVGARRFFLHPPSPIKSSF